MKIRSVCVYCASSSKVDNVFLDAAQRLGQELAKNDIQCVYGAGNQGLMGHLADSVLSHGGLVKGVIPRFMHDEGWSHSSLTEIEIVESMHHRKQRMVEGVDAAIALPGGCGTMEELLEVITWKQLGLFRKPVIILNTEGYYNDLLKMLGKAVSDNFMHEKHAALWSVVSHPEDVILSIKKHTGLLDDLRAYAAI